MQMISIHVGDIYIEAPARSQQPDIQMKHPEFIRGYQGALQSKEHRLLETFSDEDIVGLLTDLRDKSDELQDDAMIHYYAGSLTGLIAAKCLGA